MPKTAWTRCSLIARLRSSKAGRLIAAIAATLLIVQAFAGVAGASARAAHAQGAGFSAMDDCRAAHHSDPAPADRRAGHAGCCVLCDASGAPPPNPSVSAGAAPVPPVRPQSSFRSFGAVCDLGPSGFATSWSSQAPPRFS